jgi:MFS family permease
VHAHEPRVHPGLLAREDVVLLPHLGSATLETRTAMGLRAAANLEAWRDGRPLPDGVVVAPVSASEAHALRAARRAVAAVFFLDGVGVASWVVRIPDAQARLALSAGALGTVLLASALGALAAMPVAGRWVVRHGSRPVTARAALAFAASLPFIPLAPTPALLAVALFAFGATGAVLGVAMNAQAAAVDRPLGARHGRPVMAGFHALFSAGGLAGSALGGLVAGAGLDARAHLAGVALAVAAAALVVPRAMLPAGEDAAPARAAARRSRRHSPRSGCSPSACCSSRARWPTGARCTCAAWPARARGRRRPATPPSRWP